TGLALRRPARPLGGRTPDLRELPQRCLLRHPGTKAEHGVGGEAGARRRREHEDETEQPRHHAIAHGWLSLISSIPEPARQPSPAMERPLVKAPRDEGCGFSNLDHHRERETTDLAGRFD